MNISNFSRATSHYFTYHYEQLNVKLCIKYSESTVNFIDLYLEIEQGVVVATKSVVAKNLCDWKIRDICFNNVAT